MQPDFYQPRDEKTQTNLVSINFSRNKVVFFVNYLPLSPRCLPKAFIVNGDYLKNKPNLDKGAFTNYVKLK